MTKVVVSTAIELSDKQRSAITAALAAKTGSPDIAPDFVTDPSVLGGIKVIIDSQELDGTLRARLDKVEHQLVSHL